MTAPEIRLIITVGFDSRGYFKDGESLLEIVCILVAYTIDREITMCLYAENQQLRAHSCHIVASYLNYTVEKSK